MKLRRKIHRNFILITVISVLLTALFVLRASYNNTYAMLRQFVHDETGYIASALDYGVDVEAYLNVAKDETSARLTLIDTDGAVLFDNFEDPAQMENHAERKEVQEAFLYGIGEDERMSETLRQKTFYCAILLKNGQVLRAANTIDSVYRLMFKLLPVLILITLIVILISTFIARYQTKAIVKPINEIDLDHPKETDVYEEMAPLLTRIVRQQETLKSQADAMNLKQAQFLTITENMREGVVVLDIYRRVLSYNKSAVELLDVDESARQYLNKSVLLFNRSSAFQDAVKTALKGERATTMLQINTRYLQLFLNPIFKDGNINGAVLLIIDVTERQAREAMRREFSANVSHELKTPLTAISGYAEIMKDGLVEEKDVPRFAKSIYEETHRLIELVEDIIKISHLDESEPRLIEEAVDLYALTETILTRSGTQIRQKELAVTLTGTPLFVQGVKQLLDEMIANLIDNAIKYNHPGGSIDILLEQTPQGKVFTITDTGIGITKEELERVFERFYRVKRPYMPAGTGLGLSIVKHSAAYHNATIETVSEPNRGTRITITFPS